MEHIDHAVKVAGIDHVGLGSDFDGASMPFGMEDCSKLPKLTAALLARGYSEADVEKVYHREPAQAEEVAPCRRLLQEAPRWGSRTRM